MLGVYLRRPRLDTTAYLAYWLDVDRGYRGTSQQCWRVVPLSELEPSRPRWYRRQCIDLNTKLGQEGVPSVRLEPTPGGRLRIHAPVRLVTQHYDERLPHTINDGVAEVAYGSVVRAGPLLLSVLYREQVESLAEGRITLPFIGGTRNLEPDDEGLLEFVKPFVERSRTLRVWQSAFGASFIVSAAAAIAFAIETGLSFRIEPSPMDTVATCVGCILLAWTAILTVGLPIHRAVQGWFYLGGER